MGKFEKPNITIEFKTFNFSEVTYLAASLKCFTVGIFALHFSWLKSYK